MSYFNYKGHDLFYEEHGSGDALILLHGNTVCGKFFAPIIPLFTSNYRVIIPDFLGCGRSDRLDSWPEDLWYEWSLQVLALCLELKLSKVKLIGCSGGALVAINLALEHPELVGSVVADSFEGLEADQAITEQVRLGREAAKHDEGFCSFLRAMHGEDWERVFDKDTEAVVAHARSIGSFCHKAIEELKVPMLLTGSSEDELFPPRHYQELFESILSRSDRTRSHIFEHGGHPAMMSDLEEFISVCAEFFASIER